jgi:pyruvate, water dikinase
VDTLFSLTEIEAQHLCMVGEQAQQLSLLAQKDYPVIPAVVLSATRFRNFLETIHWLQPLFADLPYSSLRQIRQTIQHAELPEAWITEIQDAIAKFPALSQPIAVILRPSIFIKSDTSSSELTQLIDPQICWTDKSSLAIALKNLWAELFRARNLVYWQSTKIELQQIQFAVLIQPIGEAIVSGSLQPNSSGWELTATQGLEIAIDRGEALPEIYQIQKDQIRFQQAGRQTIAYQIQAGTEPLARSTIHQTSPILQPTQCEALLSLTQLIHTPAMLEWQFYGSQLYVTQVHSIVNSTSSPQPSEASIVSGLAAAPGTAIAPAYVLTELPDSPIPKGAILVTPMILPSWIPFLKDAAAIVSEQGGMTSHGAILARELGIPAIVGVADATQRIHTGDMILVNGDTGSVERSTQSESAMSSISRSSIGTVNATSLMLNLSQTDSIEPATELEIDGVGLLRSELMLGGTVNSQLSDQIQQFARSFAPRPVFYRSLDLRSHEFQTTPSEVNPMLGMRGTFSYLQNPTSFDLEIAALKQAIASGCSNLRLILPFVRTVEEFAFCRRRVEKVGLFDLPLWIMAEVPSVLFLLPDYVQAGVQGICIGTSDLTQLILGVDRDQSQMAKGFDETHPAVMAAIAQLIQSAHRLKIPCSISTQAAMTSEFVDRLIEWGIDAISVNLSAVEAAHRAIARAEQRFILQGIRDRASI